MVDSNRVGSLIEWLKTGDGWSCHEMDRNKYFVEPFMAAFGDDVEEILAYLDEMDVDDLDEISGILQDIYGKFMTDEVYDALGKLEGKIDRESTRTKAYRERLKRSEQ